MDAAERSILTRGFSASTMDLISREAGYSRAAMYRHFPNRRSLLAALVQRTTRRHHESMAERLPAGAGLADILVEALVIVSTELIHDPLLMTMSEQAEEGLVGQLVAENPELPLMVEAMLSAAGQGEIRPGLQPGDIGQFIVSTAITLMLGIVPGAEQPDTVRRYLETFVLPAIFAESPTPGAVFTEPQR